MHWRRGRRKKVKRRWGKQPWHGHGDVPRVPFARAEAKPANPQAGSQAHYARTQNAER